MLLKAVSATLRDLTAGLVTRDVLLGIGLSLATFVALLGAVGWLLTQTALVALPWLDTALDVLAGAAALVLTVLLFPTVMASIIGLLAEAVAGAVERRRYPGLPPPRAVGLGESVLSALRFTAAAIFLNLLVLPLYLVPGLNLVLFLAVNGPLVGREYFEMIAFRHLTPPQAKAFRRRHRGQVTLAGALIAIGLTVPVLNLLAPVLGLVLMTHLLHAETRAAE